MSLTRKSPVKGNEESESASLAERHNKADHALAGRFEQLAGRIALAEDYFASLHLPQAVDLAYNDSESRSPEGLPDSWDCLSFRRCKGRWRLCYAKCYAWMAEEGEEPKFKPLVDCAADVRMNAVSRLGKLKVEAVKAKEKYIDRVDEALAQIDEVVSD